MKEKTLHNTHINDFEEEAPQMSVRTPLKEVKSEPNGKIEEAVREILIEIGEDPNREGLLKTPERVHRMYREITSGYQIDPEEIVNGAVFEEKYDEMVIVRDIEFYSLCEHHLLPFFGKCHVAYIPNGKIIGLSKIPRIVESFSRRLQVQERMTQQIADFLNQVLKPEGVAVVAQGYHLCMAMRGVKKSQANLLTSSMTGIFKKSSTTRSEFLSLIEKPL